MLGRQVEVSPQASLWRDQLRDLARRMESATSFAALRHAAVDLALIHTPAPQPPVDTDWIDAQGTACLVAGGASAGGMATEGLPWCAAVLYLHGSGFCLGAAAGASHIAQQVSARVGAPVVVPDYRQAPQDRFPAALDDVMRAYRWVVARCEPDAPIGIVADFTGVTLALGLQYDLQSTTLPRPAAAVLFSAAVDSTGQASSWRTNAHTDVIVSPESRMAMSALYARSPSDEQDPRFNPLLGDFTALAPMYLVSGGEELTAGEVDLLVDAATRAGVLAVGEVVPGMQHKFALGVDRIPEAEGPFGRAMAFLVERLDDGRRPCSPVPVGGVDDPALAPSSS